MNIEIKLDDTTKCDGCEHLNTESFSLGCKLMISGVQRRPSGYGRNFPDEHIRPQQCIDKHGE